MNENEPKNDNAVSLPLRPRRFRWVTAVLMLIIFTAGLVTGAGLAVAVIVKRVQFAIHHPQKTARRISGALARNLRLNAKQAQQVNDVVADNRRPYLPSGAMHSPAWSPS